MAMIEMRGIMRHYDVGEVVVKAIRGLDLSVGLGEFVAVMGPSGSGKSTLMNILGCLDKPTQGFVFQGFNLLARTTALENVELPLFYGRHLSRKEQTERAKKALTDVGLGDRFMHTSSQLSGGQQQRVAIARAMVNDPAFILADEPTGNLDSEMTLEVMSLFQELNDRGKTIVMVTHEPEVANFTRRIIIMRDGSLVSDQPVRDRGSAAADLAAWKEQHSLLAGMKGAAS